MKKIRSLIIAVLFYNIRKIKLRKYSYLSYKALYELQNTVKTIESKNVRGLFLEAGCALGGSAILISLNKFRGRKLYIYDVFGQIPPPSENDDEDVHKRYETITSGAAKGINGEEYYGYKNDVLTEVINNFSDFNIETESSNIYFKKGLFEDTMTINEKVAFAHIDSDWYKSVKVCLERIVPFLEKGGVIIIDDYYTWSGARKAVDEYFKDQKDKFKFINKKSLHIEKM